MLDFKFEEFIHINSSEGSFANYHNFYYRELSIFANYHNFYYRGLSITIEDYIGNNHINYYLDKVVDGKKITDKGLTASSEERVILKNFISQYLIPSGDFSKNTTLLFLAIDKKIKRKEKIKKLLL